MREDRPMREDQRRLDLLEALGGPQGIADSSLPALVFVGVFTLAGHDVSLAAWVAVASGAVLALFRLARREQLRFVAAGFAGVAIAAFIADRTGRAEDFFLPGLLLNAGYAAAYLISILVRWPLLGVILAPLIGDRGWREDPERLRLYSRASWVWVGVFVLRLAVQLPLYLAGAVLALGIARTAMGLPIFLVAIWLSFLILESGSEDGSEGEGEDGPARMLKEP